MGRLSVAALFFACTALPAWAQLKLPSTDARGEPLATQQTVETALQQQQIIIYLLLAIVVVALGINIWMGLAFLRMQYTLERVAEAIRRVDLLAESFRSVSAQWDEAMLESVSDVVDLDGEQETSPAARIRRHLGQG